MAPNQLLWWVLFSIVSIVDLTLWTLGFLLNVGPDGRFRLLATAAMLFYVVLGMLVGWGVAAAIWFVGLWIYAIIVGAAEASADSQT
jgi:hypothetical protein